MRICDKKESNYWFIKAPKEQERSGVKITMGMESKRKQTQECMLYESTGIKLKSKK